MASLDRNLRKQLENRVKDARHVAEAGARQSIEQLAVHHHEPWSALTPDQRKLRDRLRAHARQLGDALDERKGTQPIDRLVGECAYEHWHRLLFARFLAENDLLVEPLSGMALSLDECRELARESGVDWLVLASDFAQRMLPQIFRTGDPILEVILPPEKRQELETILEGLPRDVFVADDSLGWVYQFWQTEKKAEINNSGMKVGAEELPAVTQLFTEDYMVLFLLHNTIGAWWAGKRLAEHPELARSQGNEHDIRRGLNVPGVDWTYLRLVRENGSWRPAAGAYEKWPTSIKELAVLDPCMGSGHFLVFALPILVALRQVEEQLALADAVDAVLHDNLFGLEIDPRCTQIAAFNLALAAWRLGGYRQLPRLNLACSGLGINASQEDWLRLAGEDLRARGAMLQLHELFRQAPILGSLIDPRRLGSDLFASELSRVRALLEQAVAAESEEEKRGERSVTAQGVARAVQTLLRRFTLVATNVPYLGRTKQNQKIREYCERSHPEARADLATCFVQRCLGLCSDGGTCATVTPQSWLFQTTYRGFREKLLQSARLRFVAKLGPAAFQNMNFWAATTALTVIDAGAAPSNWTFAGLDVSRPHDPQEKAELLSAADISRIVQADQLQNPESRIVLGDLESLSLLSSVAASFQGIKTGDDERYRRFFWELPALTPRWRLFQSTVESTRFYGGLERIIDWTDDGSALARRQGMAAWGKRGVMVSQMNALPVALFFGEVFDSNASPIVPKNEADLAALWAFCSSPSYWNAVRVLDQSVKPSNASLVQVPFDLDEWRAASEAQFPEGLPVKQSDDPTQWVFSGSPGSSRSPLHVAAARLLGYTWVQQRDGEHLKEYADDDGVVCIAPLRGEETASTRLRAILTVALADWSATKQNDALAAVGFGNKPLDDWFRDGFFEQHCELFHSRPFIWYIWDGRRDGFCALLNYHKLAAPHGEGRRTLEKLIYTYLGDWIDRQRADQTSGVEGADGRVAAAEHLKRELERILVGEPPYDIFVRWKPLHAQPVGWEPDLDDGVRVNIRPFMVAKPLNARGKNACILRVPPRIKWDKDRGREPNQTKADYPWFWTWDEQATDFLGGSEFDGNRWNDLHYSRDVKLAARARAKGAMRRIMARRPRS